MKINLIFFFLLFFLLFVNYFESKVQRYTFIKYFTVLSPNENNEIIYSLNNTKHVIYYNTLLVSIIKQSKLY